MAVGPALQADRWSFPVALLGTAEVVPTPAEPWWSWAAVVGRAPFWSWSGLLLLALVGLPGLVRWYRPRRPPAAARSGPGSGPAADTASGSGSGESRTGLPPG
jgi:hypothetical protein